MSKKHVQSYLNLLDSRKHLESIIMDNRNKYKNGEITFHELTQKSNEINVILNHVYYAINVFQYKVRKGLVFDELA